MCKKYCKEIYLAILVFVTLSIAYYYIPIDNLDEMWKYNAARNISMGYLPYNDFNMVTTPLYYFFNSIFLHIINELIIFRFVSIFCWCVLSIVIYKSLSHYCNQVISIGITFALITYAFSKYYVFDYNTFILLFVFIISLLLDKLNQENENKIFLFCGMILAFMDLCKQSVGIIFAILFFINILIEKKNIKSRIFYCVVGFLIPNICFLFYLIFTNSFLNFIDQCLFGLTKFVENKSNIYYMIAYFTHHKTCFIVFVAFFTYLILAIRRKENIFYKDILVSLGLLSICIPIFDTTHFLYLFIYSVIMLIKLFQICFKNNNIIMKQRKINYFIALLFIGFGIAFLISSNNLSINNKNDYRTSNLNGIKYFRIDKRIYDNFKDVNEYIIANYGWDNVEVFTVNRCFYSIMNNRNGGFYDLFLTGNIGTKDARELIKIDLSENKRVIFLKKNYDEENPQNPINIIEYIKDNCDRIGEYNEYDIYYFRQEDTRL